MNTKFALFPLCVVVFTSGCESTPSYPSYVEPSLPAHGSINEHCPEGTVARVVSDMRNMSTIECVYGYLLEGNRRAPIVAARGNRVAGTPIR